MSEVLEKIRATTVDTQFVDTMGGRLAYRVLGNGPPLLLCLRFRGVMDDWDPAFLDALAENFTVITFDYSGLGKSSGPPSYDRAALARNAKQLVDALGLETLVVGGWSIGGLAAQTFTVLFPELVSHLVLIATGPPGVQPYDAEPLFLETALKPENTIEDEYILFFEPASEHSRAAGPASHQRIAKRAAGRSPVIPEPVYLKMLQDSHDPSAIFPDTGGYAAYPDCPV